MSAKMYRNQDDEDLRNQIFHLKKQILGINAENQLLKVKVRKLQEELLKKDKQIDAVLDPKRSPNMRQILYERSASFLLNTKEKNDRLQRMLVEKDIVINRLQNQLEMARLYSQVPKRVYHCDNRTNNITHQPNENLDDDLKGITLKVPNTLRNNRSSDRKEAEDFTSMSSPEFETKPKKNHNLSWTPGLQERINSAASGDEDPVTIIGENTDKIGRQGSSYDIKEQYRGLSRDHLLSIIENLKNNHNQQRFSSPRTRPVSSRKSSPESDLDRIELCCDSPHEEIQQLHLHFLDMISEVDRLKGTIFQLQSNQQKTENVLKNKDNNLDKLAEQIKNLKRPKSRSKSSKNRNKVNNNSTITAIYSANSKSCNSRRCASNNSNSNDNNGNRKAMPRKTECGRKPMKKDVMVQVEDSQHLSADQCAYIERGSIIITKKSGITQASQTSIENQELGYEDEVFEEITADSESDHTNANNSA